MKLFNRNFLKWLPLILFIGIALFFWLGLQQNPNLLPSTLIDKPTPKFQLNTIDNPPQLITQTIFKGHITLLNVFATWCEICMEEQPVLMDIARSQQVTIVGLDYKDNLTAVRQYLNNFGNPYQTVLFDSNGQVAINWGVYGTPETFLIDKQGIIRYKLIGMLTKQTWQQQILPIVKALQKRP